MPPPAPAMPPGVTPTPRMFWCLFAVALFIVCAPHIAFANPPLLDYPNHLARGFLLARGEPAGHPAAYCQAHWTVLPNLAFDAIGIGLAKIVSIERAGQICTALAALLLGTGLAAVSAAVHGRARSFCLLGMLFVFSEPFAWGFLNLV